MLLRWYACYFGGNGGVHAVCCCNYSLVHAVVVPAAAARSSPCSFALADLCHHSVYYTTDGSALCSARIADGPARCSALQAWVLDAIPGRDLEGMGGGSPAADTGAAGSSLANNRPEDLIAAMRSTPLPAHSRREVGPHFVCAVLLIHVALNDNRS